MAQYARYRAPAESGQKLVSPPWGELCRVVAANVEWRRRADLQVLGQSLAEFAAEARREILGGATEYVAGYSDPPPLKRGVREGISTDGHHAGDCAESQLKNPSPDLSPQRRVEAPLIVTGHQPELVHPGVWVKNFAAAALCASKGALSLNLVIDDDACRSTAIRVPAGTVANPRWELVEFDRPAEEVPWEERKIVDAALWHSFPERVRKATSSLLPQRMLDDWWALAVERSAATGRIGLALAQARHLAEIEWGRRNFELPQSQMCQSTAFRRFACCLLVELPRFVAAYNSALDDYRRAHRLRNHAQPAPNLARHESWLQAPFWVWTAADPQRRPVFVRCSADGLLVSDRHSFERRLPLAAGSNPDEAVAELGRWEAEGLKLRSRALITTMFARLAVADLFIHGIGGAKYDEVTDAICERFFGAIPPAFAAISGTLHLPISHAASNGDDLSGLRQQLRNLTFHPERSIDLAAGNHDGAPHQLAVQKRLWISTPQTRLNAAGRHQGIVAANAAMQPLVAAERAELERRVAATVERARTNRILHSREYASCLFPRNFLEQFLLDFPA